jgi:DNA topoisomerase IA
MNYYRYGIGTDATMHEHIQKIQTRGYLFIKPKLFCSNHNFIRFKNFYIISKKK